MQISTKYHGPTDTRGARIVATARGRRRTVPYDHGARDPHVIAARELAAVLGLDPATVTYVGTHNGPGNTYQVSEVPAKTT